MKEQIDIFDELLIEFDEMGFVPTNFPNYHDGEYYAIDWRNRLINALAGYRKQSEWISVEDRLPAPLDDVLVCDINGNVGADFVLYTTGKFLRADVTHWMPLPQPPEMKGGE